MDITINEDGNRRTVSFGECLTINEVSDIHAEIRKYMSDSVNSLLDFSAIAKCDATGIQVLISLLKYQDSGKLNVSVGNISQAIHNTAADLGIDLNEFFYCARG